MILPQCFGVLGHPIGHSRSPAMHAAAFDALGLPHRYLAFDVGVDDLRGALRGAAALGFGGLNLTVPLKRAAVDLVDVLAPGAAEIGAVNTVCFTAEGLVGHNTDGEGFVECLPVAVPQQALVLGGGGASRAVVHALAQRGAHVRWASRRPEGLPAWSGVEPIAYDAVDAALGDVGLLVNGTTVGMSGGAARFPEPVDVARLPSDAAVVDLVYPAPRGGLVEQARARGLRAQDGLPMLWGQGVLSLQLWLARSLGDSVRLAMRAAVGAR